MSKNKNEKLDELFDVAIPSPSPLPVGNSQHLPVTLESTEEARDVHDILVKIKRMVETGSEAVDHLSMIAQETESARAYEVLATLIKNTTETAKTIMDIHKEKREIKMLDNELDGKANPTSLKQVNNTFYVGTTQELLLQLKSEMES